MFSVDELVPIVLFGGTFTMIILVSYFRNRRRERMALIEAGLDAKIFDQEQKQKLPQLFRTLKLAIVGIAMGLGLLVGEYLKNNTELNDGISYLSMLLIFGGLGLLLFYFIQNKISPQKEN